MGDAPRGAERGNERGLVRAFGAQAVIDRRDLEALRKSFMRQQQQRDAVRPAGNRKSQSRAVRRKRAQLARKAD